MCGTRPKGTVVSVNGRVACGLARVQQIRKLVSKQYGVCAACVPFYNVCN